MAAGKPGIGVLVAAMPKKDKGMSGGDGSGMIDEKESAKKAMWKAMKADDYAGWSEAQDLYQEACKADYEPDGDEAVE